MYVHIALSNANKGGIEMKESGNTRMKAITLIAVLVVIITLSIFFSQRVSYLDNENGLVIITTIYPYEMLVKQIVGEKGSVYSLIPPAASPHTYSLKPGDVKMLERADLVFSNGAGLETFMDEALEALGERHLSAYSFLQGSLMGSDGREHLASHSHSHHQHDHEAAEEESHEHCGHCGHSHTDNNRGHHHYGINPHFWLDPLLMITVARGVSNKLQSIDPSNSEYYRENSANLVNELEVLNEQIDNERKGLDEISILYFHDAFYHFNERYDIESAGVIVSSPGREPTALELAAIGKLIKEKNVRLIFVEPQLNPKAAQIIASEFSLMLDVLDPLGNPDDHSRLADLIQQNWNKIKKDFSRND